MDGLEKMMLGEISQVHKDKGHMFSLIYERQNKIHLQTLSYIYIQNMFLKEGLLE
jgi:hypothetical protein